jgi:hypothetical protein
VETNGISPKAVPHRLKKINAQWQKLNGISKFQHKRQADLKNNALVSNDTLPCQIILLTHICGQKRQLLKSTALNSFTTKISAQ